MALDKRTPEVATWFQVSRCVLTDSDCHVDHATYGPGAQLRGTCRQGSLRHPGSMPDTNEREGYVLSGPNGLSVRHVGWWNPHLAVRFSAVSRSPVAPSWGGEVCPLMLVPPGCRLPYPVPLDAALCRHRPVTRAHAIDLLRARILLRT
jgi:hypothetical protein